jgi:hypothetical protein
LASPLARQTAARWLLATCLLGYAVTMAVMSARGTGLQRWFFALLAWALFVYIPGRILLEAFQTIAPEMRRTLMDQAATRADRYRSRASIELMVEGFYDRTVLLPRIATPVQSEKAKAGAGAILVHTGRKESARLAMTVTRCLAATDTWVRELGGWAGREAAGNIQIRWAGVRAVIALAAVTKVLMAAAADRGEAPFMIPLDPNAAAEHLDAALDYCDDLALQVDVVPWQQPALVLPVSPEVRMAVRTRWMRFCDTPSPAVESRAAFVEVATGP